MNLFETLEVLIRTYPRAFSQHPMRPLSLDIEFLVNSDQIGARVAARKSGDREGREGRWMPMPIDKTDYSVGANHAANPPTRGIEESGSSKAGITAIRAC
jgi:hypothetical protein